MPVQKKKRPARSKRTPAPKKRHRVKAAQEPDPEVLARALAARWHQHMTDLYGLMKLEVGGEKDAWDEFEALRAVVERREQDDLSTSHPDDLRDKYLNIGSEAGFLYGVELGGLLAGGAR